MEFCRDLCILPYFCILVKDFEHDVKRDLEKFITKDIPKVNVFELFKSDRSPRNQMIIQFPDEISFEKFHDSHKDAMSLSIDGTQYTYSLVYQPEALTAQPCSDKTDTKLLRRIKNFSGSDKPSSGEIHLMEWLNIAYDLLQNDSQLSSFDKFRVLKNSLVGNALSLILTSNVSTPEALIDLISDTFGATLSVDQLCYEFHKCTQKENEKASVFLTRLQSHITQILRIKRDAMSDVNHERWQQFIYGITTNEHDLLSIHLDVMTYEKDPPEFSHLLKLIQSWERRRNERNDRNQKAKVKTACLNSAVGNSSSPSDQNVAVSGNVKALNDDIVIDDLESAVRKLSARVAEIVALLTTNPQAM